MRSRKRNGRRSLPHWWQKGAQQKGGHHVGSNRYSRSAYEEKPISCCTTATLESANPGAFHIPPHATAVLTSKPKSSCSTSPTCPQIPRRKPESQRIRVPVS